MQRWLITICHYIPHQVDVWLCVQNNAMKLIATQHISSCRFNNSVQYMHHFSSIMHKLIEKINIIVNLTIKLELHADYKPVKDYQNNCLNGLRCNYWCRHSLYMFCSKYPKYWQLKVPSTVNHAQYIGIITLNFLWVPWKTMQENG